MINCMVIDDQIQSLELMVDHIRQIPSLNLKCATHNAIEALHFLEKEKVDCIFLDIEMPQLTGLEFVETLKSRLGNAIPKIILVTGYSQYALSGFDHGVFDYIVKPVSFKRFKISVDRLSEVIKSGGEPRNFFFVDSDGQKIKIDFTDIVYIEAAGNYISIVMSDRKIMCYKSMSSVQEILPDGKFIRIHKSYIVSVDNIHSFRGNEIFINHNNTQKSMPIGITYKEKLMKLLRIAE